jgi:hypothetical protein
VCAPRFVCESGWDIHADPGLTKLVVLGGLLWLLILLMLTLSDFTTRGWIGVPGR